MNKFFIGLFIFTVLQLSAQEQPQLDRKLSVGLTFSGIFFSKALSEKTIDSELDKSYTDIYGYPSFGIGFFIEYHINKHSIGFSQQSVYYDNEYSYYYKDSTDGNNNTSYHKGLNDYTEYKFNNFFAFYKYSFVIAQFQPSVKVAVGYHSANLTGNTYYSYYNDFSNVSFNEEWSDQKKINYWSVKPEVEGAFRFSKRMGIFLSFSYDFALSTSQKYEYDYDNELVEKGYINGISRTFIPSDYFEIRLGIVFSF